MADIDNKFKGQIVKQMPAATSHLRKSLYFGPAPVKASNEDESDERQKEKQSKKRKTIE